MVTTFPHGHDRWRSLFENIIPVNQLNPFSVCCDEVGIELYDAAYSVRSAPDLNPIELAFSKLKTLLRKAAERTIPGLCRRIGPVPENVQITSATGAMFLNDRNPL